MVVSLVCLFAAMTYLMGGALTETHRIDKRVDKVRQPVCSILFIGLSHPPATTAQAQVRKDYIEAYGKDGLNCPKPLPDVG